MPEPDGAEDERFVYLVTAAEVALAAADAFDPEEYFPTRAAADTPATVAAEARPCVCGASLSLLLHL